MAAVITQTISGRGSVALDRCMACLERNYGYLAAAAEAGLSGEEMRQDLLDSAPGMWRDVAVTVDRNGGGAKVAAVLTVG